MKKSNGDGFPVRFRWLGNDGQDCYEDFTTSALPSKGDEVVLNGTWYIVARVRFLLAQDIEAFEVILDSHPEVDFRSNRHDNG